MEYAIETVQQFTLTLDQDSMGMLRHLVQAGKTNLSARTDNQQEWLQVEKFADSILGAK